MNPFHIHKWAVQKEGFVNRNLLYGHYNTNNGTVYTKIETCRCGKTRAFEFDNSRRGKTDVDFAIALLKKQEEK